MDQAKTLKDTYKIVEEPDSTKRIVLKNAFYTGSEILSVRFDAEDSLVATGQLDGYLKIHHLQSSALKIKMNISGLGNPTPCTCIRWRPPNASAVTQNVITTGDGLGNVIQWHTTSGKELSRVSEKDNQILCMDYNNQGQYLATGGKDSDIRIYDEASKVLEFKLSGQGYSNDNSHQNRIFSLKFSPENSHTLVSGSWDQNINIWDLRQQKCVGGFLGGKISGDSVDCKNGQILVGNNSARDQLKIFDLGTRKLIQQIDYDKEQRENGAFLFAAQFSKNNEDSFAVGGSGKNEVKIFDRKQNCNPIGKISNFNKGIYSLDYGNMSGKIAMGGADGLLVVVSLASK